MSQWEELGIKSKLERILTSFSRKQSPSHLGIPFLSAYQLAILYAQKYPEDLQQLGFPVGGKDTGAWISLAKYLARELSAGIKTGKITTIEGMLLSNRQVKELVFDNDGEILRSSITGRNASISMFRLKKS
jgi:hypothetical protein